MRGSDSRVLVVASEMADNSYGQKFNVLNTQSVLCVAVAVSSIKEVRQGKTTDALRNKEIAGMYPDECAFSIIFGDDFESLDLIANTPDEANIWVTGMTCLVNANTKQCEYQREGGGEGVGGG